jgi:alpha-glucosidase
MQKVRDLDVNRALWRCTIKKVDHSDTTIYAFKIIVDSRQIWLHGGGFAVRLPPKHLHFRFYHKLPPPAWLPDQIFYEIVPDRFCRGEDRSIAVKSDEYTYLGKPVVAREWGRTPSDHPDQMCHEFFGGDLYGVISKLSYLQEELGVTTLYTTPIFCSPSNHKYDSIDYLNVDRHLGGNKAFAMLCEQLHIRGMKIVLDSVINHHHGPAVPGVGAKPNLPAFPCAAPRGVCWRAPQHLAATGDGRRSGKFH